MALRRPITERYVVACPSCNGIGTTSSQEMTDYHKCEYDTHHNVCRACLGEGRVGRVVVTSYESLVVSPRATWQLKPRPTHDIKGHYITYRDVFAVGLRLEAGKHRDTPSKLRYPGRPYA